MKSAKLIAVCHAGLLGSLLLGLAGCPTHEVGDAANAITSLVDSIASAADGLAAAATGAATGPEAQPATTVSAPAVAVGGAPPRDGGLAPPAAGGPAPPLSPQEELFNRLNGKVFTYELTQVTGDTSLYSNNRLSLCSDGQFFLEANVGTTTSLGSDAFLWRRSGAWRLVADAAGISLELRITYDSRRSLVPYTAYRSVLIDASGAIYFDADASAAQVVGACGAGQQGGGAPGAAGGGPGAAAGGPGGAPQTAPGAAPQGLAAALERKVLMAEAAIPDSQLIVATIMLLCPAGQATFVELVLDGSTGDVAHEVTAWGRWSIRQQPGAAALDLQLERWSDGQPARAVSFDLGFSAAGELLSLSGMPAGIQDGSEYCPD